MIMVLNPRRPIWVWVFSVILAILTLFVFISNLQQLFSSTVTEEIFRRILSIVGAALTGIFVWEFFMLKKRVVLWLHIAMGYGVLDFLWKIIRGELTNIIPMIIIILIWFGLYEFIHKKQIGAEHLFT